MTLFHLPLVIPSDVSDSARVSCLSFSQFSGEFFPSVLFVVIERRLKVFVGGLRTPSFLHDSLPARVFARVLIAAMSTVASHTRAVVFVYLTRDELLLLKEVQTPL